MPAGEISGLSVERAVVPGQKAGMMGKATLAAEKKERGPYPGRGLACRE